MKTLIAMFYATIFVFFYTVAIVACGSKGSPSQLSQAPVNNVTPAPSSSTTGGAVDPAITYYKMVVNETVNQGGNNYPVQVIGYCLQYNSVNYCWDNGWQTNAGLTNYETDFWGLCDNNGTIGECSGGTTTDPVTNPTTWDSTLEPLPPYLPSDVYSKGIATTVNCSVLNGVITCPTFQVDTNQMPL